MSETLFALHSEGINAKVKTNQMKSSIITIVAGVKRLRVKLGIRRFDILFYQMEKNDAFFR